MLRSEKETMTKELNDKFSRATAIVVAGFTKVDVATVNKAKPAGAKGHYINRISLSSTMGPGVKVDTAEIINRHK